MLPENQVRADKVIDFYLLFMSLYNIMKENQWEPALKDFLEVQGPCCDYTRSVALTFFMESLESHQAKLERLATSIHSLPNNPKRIKEE